MALNKVAVFGMGKVGALVGTLLQQSGFEVRGVDAAPRSGMPFATLQLDLNQAATYSTALESCDAVVSCLPYWLNLAIAKAAYDAGIHYFDLTEDVNTTKAIRHMSNTSRGLMAPQCGLAPGFIAIVGSHLARQFDQLRSIELRVGALPMHPRGKLGYALNW